MNFFSRIFFSFFGAKIIANCGHETRRRGRIHAFGANYRIKIPIIDGQVEYCLGCLEKMTIRCAWCGEPIIVGDPITLYSPKDKNHKMPEYAVPYGNGSYVGCLRWNCAITGADRAGFWYPPGEVMRVPTPIEMCLQDIQRGGSGVIIIEDTSDPQEALKGLEEKPSDTKLG